jgi:signal transduction histidine kinase
MRAQQRSGAPGLRWAPAELPPTADLAQQVAHDLRQPVAAIMALVSAALVEAHLPDPVRGRLGQIAEQASWMSKVIGDLLANDGTAPGTEPVELSALLRDAVEAERLTYPGLILLDRADAGPRYVMAARTPLRRAFANVLANATRAAGPRGRVELTERAQAGMELVEIVDDGPGFGNIEPDNGIGLRITRRMLAECGGRMEHERLPSGQTLVRLMLPRASAGRRAGAQ